MHKWRIERPSFSSCYMSGSLSYSKFKGTSSDPAASVPPKHRVQKWTSNVQKRVCNINSTLLWYLSFSVSCSLLSHFPRDGISGIWKVCRFQREPWVGPWMGGSWWLSFWMGAHRLILLASADCVFMEKNVIEYLRSIFYWNFPEQMD